MVTLFHYLPISCLYICIIYKHNSNLLSMHKINIYGNEIISFEFNLLFIHNINCSKCYILYI